MQLIPDKISAIFFPVKMCTLFKNAQVFTGFRVAKTILKTQKLTAFYIFKI